MQMDRTDAHRSSGFLCFNIRTAVRILMVRRLHGMRVARILLVFFVLSFLVLCFLWSVRSPYIRFMGKDQQYYSDLAHACDRVLAQHPLGTNAVIRISGGDASVPS